MHWLDVTITVLKIVGLPILWLAHSIIYLLHWLVSPFLFLGRIVKELTLLPWRFLAQFETLWYFLGCAILTGTLAAGIGYGTFRICVVVFDLDRKSIPKAIPATGHDAASYRAARAEKKQKEREKRERQAVRARLLASQPLIQEVVREARSRPIALSSPLSPNTGTAATRSGLFQDIILEHSDESDGYGF